METLDQIKSNWKEQAVPAIDISKLKKRINAWNGIEYSPGLLLAGGILFALMAIVALIVYFFIEDRALFGILCLTVLSISSAGYFYRYSFFKKYKLKDQPLRTYLEHALGRAKAMKLSSYLITTGQVCFYVLIFFVNGDEPSKPRPLVLILALIFVGILFLAIAGAAIVQYKKFYLGSLGELEQELKEALVELDELEKSSKEG